MGCLGGRRWRVVPKAQRVPVGQLPDDPAAAIELEYLTPMLLIPFFFFVQLGRIPKSTKPWREEARSKGWLVEYRREDGKIIIFISQTWWDREYLDPDRDPNDKYDVGGPDWQENYPDQAREVDVEVDGNGSSRRRRARASGRRTSSGASSWRASSG